MVNKAEEKAEVRVTSILTYDKKLVESLNPYFRQKYGRDILIWDTSKRDDDPMFTLIICILILRESNR